MTDYIMNDPKLTHDGRYVKQGFSKPEDAPTGQLLSENARITKKATNTDGELRFDGAVGLDTPYTGNDLPKDHFKSVTAEPEPEPETVPEGT